MKCSERVWHDDGSYHPCGRPAKYRFERVDGSDARPLCGVHQRALRRWIGHGWIMVSGTTEIAPR